MLALDLTDESNWTEELPFSREDSALVHRGGSFIWGRAVADSKPGDRMASADSARGGGSSVRGEGAVPAFDGRGRDPTGRAGRLFRRFDR
jgi:hypothetical protein